MPSCWQSARSPDSTSNCQSGRARQGKVCNAPSAASPRVSAPSMIWWASGSKISLGCKRSSSARSVAVPSPSSTVSRPRARSTHARPKREISVPSITVYTAANKFSRRSSSNAASVTVPGVKIRTTARSTGPRVLPTSPTCSQIATDSPLRSRRAR